MIAAEQRSPFGPAPLQSLRPYYGLLRPCASHRYSDPRGLSRLRSLPLHRGTGSHVPYKSLVELRAAYMPDAARAGFRVLPSWSRRKGHPPVLTSSNPLSTVHRRFACARLSQPHPPGYPPNVNCNAHHHRSWRQQLAAVWGQNL